MATQKANKADPIKLTFDPKIHPQAGRVRDDISSCALTGDFLWNAVDESSHIEPRGLQDRQETGAGRCFSA